MNLNLLIRELKTNIKGSIVAGFSVAAFMAFSLAMYSSMQESINRISEIYSTMSKTMQVALNVHPDQWMNVLGFYVTYFVYYVPLMLGCYSAILGVRQVSKEEQYRTAEFLLTRPLSRGQVITSKLFSLIILIMGFNLLIFMVGLVGCGIVSEWNFDLKSFTVLHTYGFLICLVFCFLGIFITVLMKRAKAVTGVAIGIVMASYFFDIILRVSDKVQFLLYFTPFHYINLNVLSTDYGFDAWRLYIPIGTSAVLIVLAHLFYRKKDILV